MISSRADQGGRGPGFWVAVVFMALAVAYSVAVHFTSDVLPEDDAFITYRYVENLVAGKGLVYNPGQRVFGASSPAYLVWLAGLKVLLPGVELPTLAVRADALFYLATAFGLLLLLRRLLRSPALAAVCVGLYALRDSTLQSSLGGMETFLFAALLMFGLWALYCSRFTLASWLAGISVMVRPEGVFLVAVVLAGWLLASRRRPGLVVTGLLLPGLVWVAFALAFFGTPIYHSLIAKSRPLYPLPPGRAATALLSRVSSWTFGGDMSPVRGVLAPVTGAAILLGLLAVRVLVRPRDDRVPAEGRVVSGRVLPAPEVVLLLLLLAFYGLANPFVFNWYYPPLELLWFVAFVAAAGGLARSARPSRPWLARAVIAASLVLLAAPAARTFVSQAASGQSVMVVALEYQPYRRRVRTYRQAAEWLNHNLPAGAEVLASEVGSLGYYYKGPMLDACGLVSPEALPFLPAPPEDRPEPGCGVIPRALVQALRPEVIVTLPRFAELSLYQDAGFWDVYAKVEQIGTGSGTWWPSAAVDVLVRKDRLSDLGLDNREPAAEAPEG